MSVAWEVAPEEVIEMAQGLVEKYHPDLRNANIGILFRETASTRNGKKVLGQASKVTAKWQPLLDGAYHFIIWLAADWWLDEASPAQRRALLDHELQHCYMLDGLQPKLRGHDLEEFACIIERHGFWRDDWGEQQVQAAIRQVELPFVAPAGRVSAIDPHHAFVDEVAEAFEAEEVLAE